MPMYRDMTPVAMPMLMLTAYSNNSWRRRSELVWARVASARMVRSRIWRRVSTLGGPDITGDGVIEVHS
ncbi:MAG TPA: hypothetical protein VFY58_03270 [Nocardioides sp.]|nr:hypothetical protein [Nocardioides sp.]